MDSITLAEKLSQILTPGQVSIREDDRVIYSRDIMPLDTIRIQAGVIGTRPDVVVWPEFEGQVVEVMKFAHREGIPVIPFGAGSGVAGGTSPVRGGIVMDLKRMDKLCRIEDHNLIAVVEPGMIGEIFERELNRRGYTNGHFPSSIYCSTVGGWLAARGAGQMSSRYGKAEDRVMSLRAVLADGRVVETPEAPRSATGPDWVQAIVGSEGTFAVITEIKWKISPAPASREFHSFHFPTLGDGMNAVRMMFQAGVRPAVCRLYDPVDTLIAGSGKSAVTQGPKKESKLEQVMEDLQGVFPNWPRAVLPRVLSRPKIVNSQIRKRAKKSRLVLMFEGAKAPVAIDHKRAVGFCMANGGADLGPDPAKKWLSHRYAVSYGMSPVFDLGLFVDTMEVSTRWSNLERLYDGMMDAFAPHAFTMAHFSHAYEHGCSIYFTFAAGGVDLRDRLVKYRKIWDSGMEACLKLGGAISHHHGVGILKDSYMVREHGEGMKLMRALKGAFDEKGILNPGKLGL